jgi:sulfite exporter TauE/SafE
MEAVHSETYSLLIDTYIEDRAEKLDVLQSIQNVPCIQKKAAWACQWINSDEADFPTRLLAFAIVGMGLDVWLPKPAFLSSRLRRVQTAAFKMKSTLRAALLGFATPLLPCGPLYMMFALAMANGSASRGAEFAMAFGLGTLPLLWLAQTQLHWLGGRLQPATMRKLQRGLALVTAIILAWRLRDTLDFGSTEVPSCCHAAM